MKTYKIHFIRHGLTRSNIDGRYIGSLDITAMKNAEVMQTQKKEKTFLDKIKEFIFN